MVRSVDYYLIELPFISIFIFLLFNYIWFIYYYYGYNNLLVIIKVTRTGKYQGFQLESNDQSKR